MEKQTLSPYPKYFRKAGKCVKVVSATQCRTIILPPDVQVAERFGSTYPSSDRQAEALKGLEEVDPQMWTDFMMTFYSQVVAERDEVRRLRDEIRTDAATLNKQ